MADIESIANQLEHMIIRLFVFFTDIYCNRYEDQPARASIASIGAHSSIKCGCARRFFVFP
jgi:hypothetical protein